MGERSIAIYKGQVWIVIYGGEPVRMEVLGADRDHVTLGEIPWPKADPNATRRILYTSLTGLVLSAALDDRAVAVPPDTGDLPDDDGTTFSDEDPTVNERATGIAPVKLDEE